MMNNKRWYLVLLALGLTTTVNADQKPLSPAKVNYMLQCQGCHLADGRGSAQGVPDITEYGERLLGTETGRRFFIQVPGSSNSPLTNSQLVDVLNYIVADILHTANVPQFTLEEIEAFRGKPIDDVVAYRAELIQQLLHSSEAPPAID